MKKIELLAPAGDLEKLKIAILYGADAVFIGGQRFSLRARASNFTIDDIKEATAFAHAHNAHVHVTCNILPHLIDLNEVKEYIQELEKANVDAIITSSPLIMKEVLKTKMALHVSTQESTLNSNMVDFWANFGAERIVLGRELDIESIKEIKKNTDREIEVFIHGGMCVSYSGRCMLSNNMTNRDANRGGCAHSCRWNYDLYNGCDKINDDLKFAISSKDLCSIPLLKQILDTNVDSLKIEGRMKSLHYIATVVKAYRNAIDEYYQTGDIKNYEKYLEQIKKCENRETSTGFLDEMNSNKQLYDLFKEEPTQEFIGIVLDYDKEKGLAKVDVRNYFANGSIVEVFSPKNEDRYFKLEKIYNEEFESLDCANHPRDIVYVNVPFEVYPNDMLRLKNDN